MAKPGILRNLKINRIALVDAGANFDKRTGDGAHILYTKSAGPNLGDVHVDTPADVEIDETKPKEKPVKKNLLKRMLDAMRETDVTKRDAALTDIEKEFPNDNDDEKVHKAGDAMCKCADCMMKRAPDPEVAKRMESIEKANTDLQKRLDAQVTANELVTKALNAEIEKRADGEMLEVLKSFRHTSFDFAKDVPLFRTMKSASPEAFDRAMAILKAQDATNAGMFSEMGSSRSGGGAGSAWSEIEAKADALFEKSASGTMTREQAIDKVCIDPKNMGLMKRHRAEQQ